MKVAFRMFLIICLFFVAVTPFYIGWQNRDYGSVPEIAGPVALFITALMMAMIGFYLWLTSKKYDVGPEDRDDGEISDVEGDYGFFTPYSWWPFFLGVSCAILFAGLAVGWWLFAIGLAVAPIAVVGWTFEHFKGEHAN